MRRAIGNAIEYVLLMAPIAGPPLPTGLRVFWPSTVTSKIPTVIGRPLSRASSLYVDVKAKTVRMVRGY